MAPTPAADPSAGQLALMAGLQNPAGTTAPAALPLTALPGAAPTTPATPVPMPANLQTAYAKAPGAFEPNEGQTDSQVQYLAHGPGLSLFLTNSSAVLVLPRPSSATTGDQTAVSDVVQLQFVGANPNPQSL